MKKEIESWFSKARDDLKKAKDNYNIENYDLASFLCQQSVEKALKSLSIKRTGDFPKIHDLVRLGKLLDLNEDLLKKCERLNPVYIETRYPDVSEDRYNSRESKEDIKIAEEILSWVEKNI